MARQKVWQRRHDALIKMKSSVWHCQLGSSNSPDIPVQLLQRPPGIRTISLNDAEISNEIIIRRVEREKAFVKSMEYSERDEMAGFSCENIGIRLDTLDWKILVT